MEALITGFEPFLSFKENPSQLIAKNLDGQNIDGVRLTGAVLKVSYEDALVALDKLLKEKRWDIVLSLGLNPLIGWIAVERFAHNIKESEEPDERGVLAEGEEIIPGGETVLKSGLPVRRIIQSLREEGIPSAVSHSAGGYLCNAVFYFVLHRIGEWKGVGGFLHIPLHTEYVARERKHYGRGHMPLELIERGVVRALQITIEEGVRQDRHREG